MFNPNQPADFFKFDGSQGGLFEVDMYSLNQITPDVNSIELAFPGIKVIHHFIKGDQYLAYYLASRSIFWEDDEAQDENDQPLDLLMDNDFNVGPAARGNTELTKQLMVHIIMNW